jgi:tryptophan synthase alpha chain
MTTVRRHLEARRAAGHKLLVPYLMAGLPARDEWERVLKSIASLGDAVEIGLPYSDPLMDGPVIADAGTRALADGITPSVALELASAPAPVPKIVMTYYNPIHRVGESEWCRRANDAGVAGLIVPDLPLEESSSLRSHAANEGLEWIPLVAPTSSAGRVKRIAATATGFVYAVSTLGVTGRRSTLSERAAAVAAACKDVTDLPVLVGIGVSSPDQAVEASSVADGVVIGSAVVSRLLDESLDSAAAWLATVREALN